MGVSTSTADVVVWISVLDIGDHGPPTFPLGAVHGMGGETNTEARRGIVRWIDWW